MDKISNNITKKLVSMEENPSIIKPFMYKHLENIEIYLLKVENKYKNALEVLKFKKYSVSTIAKELNMSRTTLYNHNQLLKHYIEHSITFILKNSQIIQITKQNIKINKLQTDIELLYDRDITLEIQKIQLKN